MVELGTLITQAKTVRCGESNYPVLSMTMHDGLVLQDDRFKKAIASKDKSDYKVVYRDQLVISFPIDEGVLATQRITDAGIVSPAYGIWDVDQEKVVPEFLEYALRCKRSIAYYKAKLRGSTARRRSLPTPTLLAHTVPLPSIEEQKYVLDLIHKVETIIHLRKDELKELDALTKARFVELFGDRYINDKMWPSRKLGDCISFNNGKAHEQVVDENGEYILVTSRAIASDFLDVRRTNALLFPLHKNDIVMVMSDVPNGRALAKCQLIDEDEKYTLNQRICSFDNYDYNPIFLLYLLNRHQYFLDFDDGNSQTNLRKNDILGCNLINPPMELQDRFAEFVKQVDKSKAAVQKSLDETQVLFDSLMQKYFG